MNLEIKKNSIPDLICEKMQTLITNGTWQVDEKIPSEAELAKMFKVNRFTVRMSLQKLNTLGIVETRIGDGTYVRSFDYERLMQSVSPFYITPEMLDAVSEFRAAVEIACVRLAMKRYTSEELSALKDCCAVFEKNITAYVNAGDDTEKRKELFERFNDDDIALHTQLCTMSGNELLIRSYVMAKDAIRQQMLTLGHRRVVDLKPGDDIISVSSHWSIYRAMERRDFRTCKKILSEMIDNDVEQI